MCKFIIHFNQVLLGIKNEISLNSSLTEKINFYDVMHSNFYFYLRAIDKHWPSY